MPIINKTKNTAAIFNRGHEVVKVYDHGKLAWQKQTSIPDYLCFTALEAGQFTLTIKASVGVGNLRYMEWSKDGKTWNHVDNEASVEKSITVDVAVGDKVYWRGQGVNMTASSAAIANCSQFSSTARFDVSGHIMSLLKGDDFLNYQHLTDYDTDGVRNVTFTYLFYGCTTLVNAKDLILPTFTSYYTYIFQYMFRSCTALVSAPNLPSLDTAPYCYGYMFNLCTSLTQAPSSIAATTLRTQCCRSMFEGDTALVTAPSIAATTLVGGSELYRTFSGCTSLVTPPSDLLPTLINVASYYMTFNNCSSMTTMPTLHFTSIASDGVNACSNMFSGCSSLTGEVTIDVPSAPKSAFNGTFGSTRITKAYVRCPIAGDESFRGTFFNVQTLSDIDIIGATSVGVNTYHSCFYGCRATRQNIVLPAAILAEGCYKQMFYSSNYTINKVTCLATDISATDCLTNWLINASSTGTFIQASGVEWPRGASGIPTGWVDVEKRSMPSGYKQVEYLQAVKPYPSNYNAAIVGTGIVLDPSQDTIEFAVWPRLDEDGYLINGSDTIYGEMPFANTSSPTGNNVKVGAFYVLYRVNSSINMLQCVYTTENGDSNVRAVAKNVTSNVSVTDNPQTIRIEFSATSAVMLLNGTQVSSASGYTIDTSDMTTMQAFVLSYNARTYSWEHPFYYLKWWRGGTMIADYVPCVRESDDEVGFYDFVSQTFKTRLYTNSEPFTAGEEI